MAEFPALPLWTDAFLADTTHLDTRGVGAYLLLLFAAWRAPDCDLPDDDKLLARMARLSLREWRQIGPSIRAFFAVNEQGRLIQKRLLKERFRVRDVSIRAKRAADAKWLKTKNSGYADAYPEHMPDGCGTDATISITKDSTPFLTTTESLLFKSESLTESEATRENSRAAPARGTRLPKDWFPSQALVSFAERLGLNAETTADTFRDHWIAQPGAKGVKTDWPATWRNWCRRQPAMRGNSYGQANGLNGAGKPSKISHAIAVLERSKIERRAREQREADLEEAGDYPEQRGTFLADDLD